MTGTTRQIGILNGPNLQAIGQRQPELYGSQSWIDFWPRLQEAFPEVQLHYAQHQGEGALIEQLYTFAESCTGLVLNAGAYTHSSLALADAVAALSIPTVEVHLTNVWQREAFRHHSYLSPVVQGVIAGLGLEGYRLAVAYLVGETGR